jgi:hypothetical protein
MSINTLREDFDISLVVAGLSDLVKIYSNLPFITKSFGEIKTDLKNNGFDLVTTEDDYTFFYTSWENWQRILRMITKIMKVFPWLAERGDCDQRADTTSNLTGLITKITTCGNIKCKRTSLKTGKTVWHRCNLVIDQEGKTYLYDIDNSGKTTRAENEDVTMGNYRYFEFEDAQYH